MPPSIHPAPPVEIHPGSLVPLVALAVALAVLLLVGAWLTARR